MGIDQSKVRSGFDAEVLLGEGYLQMLLGTALDAGLIPYEEQFGTKDVILGLIPQEFRLYEPTTDSDGNIRATEPSAFKTEILFGHPLGANIKTRLMLGEKGGATPLDVDLFVKIDLIKTFDETNALTDVAMNIEVVDFDSSELGFILGLRDPPYTKDELLTKLKEKVDRQLDIGGVSKFKRVEDVAIKWHEAIEHHPACLGIYINIHLRNGDPEDDFLPRRGDTVQARNFLPEDEDMAMASRPGLYNDMALDVFSETAVPNGIGGFEHAFRKSLLHPNSKRLGDLHSVSVGRIPPQMINNFPVPQNGMRITVEGDIRDPIDATNTDLTYTIDLRPKLADDGQLEWNTTFNASVDAVFEFTTLWAVALLGILLGPYGALIALGVVFVAELGVGIGITLYKENSVKEQANAKLADIIPDRLTIKTRRWDPFYATLHQVVTKPTQAEFNDKGFMMCGKAFIGRQLVPPVNTIIRDEVRDAQGTLTGMRYQIDDFETVLVDSILDAPGVSRRDFDPPAADAEQDLWALSLESFEQRKNDPEGPLILTKIPYFESAVWIREHQIDGVLCISGYEIEQIQDQIRESIKEQGREGIRAHQGAQIRMDVMNDFGPNATEEEIEAEVDKRIEDKLKAAMEKYQSPEPLQMAFNGDLQPFLRFDVSPEELVLLQNKEVILLDSAVRAIHGKRVSDHTRDRPDRGPDGKDDNLLNRPRYKPSPTGPIFK